VKQDRERQISSLRRSLYLKNWSIKKLQQKEQNKKELLDKKKVEQIIASIQSFLAPVEHALVAMQLWAAIGKRPRFTNEYNTFALSVYYKSPSCYRFLSSRFKLPAVSTICKWKSRFQVNEGFCQIC
jgi:hypothetical protein